MCVCVCMCVCVLNLFNVIPSLPSFHARAGLSQYMYLDFSIILQHQYPNYFIKYLYFFFYLNCFFFSGFIIFKNQSNHILSETS